MRHLASLLVSTLLILCCAAAVQAASASGILLVAFGTTMESAEPALQSIDKAYRKAYPDKPIVWAYTSDIIRKKLNKQGSRVLSVKQALDECARLGIVDLRVQSLHVTGAEEYAMTQRMLVRDLSRFPNRFDHVWLGAPLLESGQDLQDVMDAIFASFPKERKSNEAVVLMGHGNNRGPGDLAIAQVATAFNQRDPLVFLAAVEGSNTFDSIIPELKKRNVTKVYLQPFMIVAGDHAINDLAGPEPDSWASQLKAAGMQVEAQLTGLGSLDGIQKVFLRHTRDTRDDLANPKKTDD
ncbi:cobalt chelatase [Desulfovibrio sp. An276]|uniref:sirohydrochlorin cobaltochelatase n=1 Tax=Desulfovibrio sp. An276 TaxID=1965618 RepID=UPI000B3ACF2B|nr:sirohydrochlorin cobaltochelatase [Desulfovibrio sp. An276]OUO52953.1 cobalt chelatase [Desulfovibrio sp. An276]